MRIDTGTSSIHATGTCAIATELTESVDSEEQQWLDELTAKWYESVKKPAKPTIAGFPIQAIPDPQEQSEIFAYRERNKDQRPSARFVRGVASLRNRLANEEKSYLAAVQRVAQHAYMDGMFKGFACLLGWLYRPRRTRRNVKRQP